MLEGGGEPLPNIDENVDSVSPWGGFGHLLAPLGVSWGALGSYLGAKSGAKSVKGDFKIKKGGARTLRM